LSQWPIDRLRRRRAEYRHKPLVVVRTVANRPEVVAVSNEAAAAGVRAGMTLTQARALRADVLHVEENPLRDRVTLEALGRWMMRFTPLVQPVGPAENGAAALLMDVTGCERLFGGMHRLVAQVSDALRKLRFNAQLAVAPTIGAAWAVSMVGSADCPINGSDELAEALAPLPPGALRIEPAAQQMLHHLGLETIGQVMRLPRDQLPARFGAQLLLRIDQALGRVAEPLVPLIHQSPIEAAMEFDGVIDSLETIHLVLRQLLERIVAELHHRGRGARVLEMLLFRPHDEPIRKEVRLSMPSRNVKGLFNLLECALERNEDATMRRRKGSHSLHHPFTRSPAHPLIGFSGLRLSVPESEPLSAEQIMLMEQQEHDGRLELGRLVERLRVRLGDEAVVQAEPVALHLPERAWREVAESETRRQGDKETRRRDPFPLSPCPRVPVSPRPHPRPLHLLPRPVEVGVIVSPCDAREGRPVSFSRGRRVHRIVHAVGPERLAGLWWEGHNKTRDYFDVEDADGRRFWLFRVMQSGRWFLHGLFV
jgi:protein ImuB